MIMPNNDKGLTTATDSDYFVTIEVYKKIGV